jgi:hypothetical protein
MAPFSGGAVVVRWVVEPSAASFLAVVPVGQEEGIRNSAARPEFQLWPLRVRAVG